MDVSQTVPSPHSGLGSSLRTSVSLDMGTERSDVIFQNEDSVGEDSNLEEEFVLPIGRRRGAVIQAVEA